MKKELPQSPHGWMQEDLEKEPSDAYDGEKQLEIGEGDINFNTAPLKLKFNPIIRDKIEERLQHMIDNRRKKLTSEQDSIKKAVRSVIAKKQKNALFNLKKKDNDKKIKEHDKSKSEEILKKYPSLAKVLNQINIKIDKITEVIRGKISEVMVKLKKTRLTKDHLEQLLKDKNFGSLLQESDKDLVLVFNFTPKSAEMEKLAPGRPPKKFLTEMKQKLKKQYPSYGDKRLTTIAAGIWHNYSDATKNKLTKEYEG